jgi:pimeloyl-ACP methyl ester carboxylesterase
MPATCQCCASTIRRRALSGNLLEASIGDWLEEAAAMLGLLGERRTLVVGSSMGGWIALVLARQLARAGEIDRLAGLVLIVRLST